MLSPECLGELRSAWLPHITEAGLDRLVDLLEKSSPLLIHGCFTRAMPMGCLATHIAWHHPRTVPFDPGCRHYLAAPCCRTESRHVARLARVGPLRRSRSGTAGRSARLLQKGAAPAPLPRVGSGREAGWWRPKLADTLVWIIRAARQRSKRLRLPLTPLRVRRGSDKKCYRLSGKSGPRHALRLAIVAGLALRVAPAVLSPRAVARNLARRVAAGRGGGDGHRDGGVAASARHSANRRRTGSRAVSPSSPDAGCRPRIRPAGRWLDRCRPFRCQPRRRTRIDAADRTDRRARSAGVVAVARIGGAARARLHDDLAAPDPVHRVPGPRRGLLRRSAWRQPILDSVSNRMSARVDASRRGTGGLENHRFRLSDRHQRLLVRHQRARRHRRRRSGRHARRRRILFLVLVSDVLLVKLIQLLF